MRNTEEEGVEEFEDVFGAVVDIPFVLFLTDERRSHSPEYQRFPVGNSSEFCPPPALEQLSREDRHGEQAQLPQLSLAPWHHFSRREKKKHTIFVLPQRYSQEVTNHSKIVMKVSLKFHSLHDQA